MTMDPARVARAAEALEDGRTRLLPGEAPGTFTVRSFTRPDAAYTVDLQDRSCTCPDASFRGVTCKHLYAVALTRGLT